MWVVRCLSVPSKEEVVKENRRSMRRSGRVNGRRMSGVMRNDLRVYNSPSAKTAGLNVSPEQIMKRAERFSTVTRLSKRLEREEKMEQRAKRFGVDGNKRPSDPAEAGSSPKKAKTAEPELTPEEQEMRKKRLERFSAKVQMASSRREAEPTETNSDLKTSESFDDSVDPIGDEELELHEGELEEL